LSIAHRPWENLREMVALVRCRRDCLLPGALDGCCWWETVWRTRALRYYTNENINLLRVACSECNFTVFSGRSEKTVDFITGDLKMLSVHKHLKAYCLLFVYLWNKCFQDG
jgi:hypothetical protein